MKPDNTTILATIKAHATTKTYAEIAALLGVTFSKVITIAREAGFKKPPVAGKLRSQHAYVREVILAHASTHSLAQIAPMLGVTKQRVHQLYEKWRIKRHNFMYSPLRGMSRRQLRVLVGQPCKTLAQIAGEAGVSAGTLRNELRRRGIEPFPKRERDARLLKRGMKVCGRCRRTKPIEQFTRDANRQSGYSCRCLECGRAYINARRKREANAKR